MKIIKLDEKINHGFRSGKRCEYHEPNIKEDTLFMEGDEIVGFYLKSLPERANKLAAVCDAEFRSNRVPKQEMMRSDVMKIQKEGSFSRAVARQFGTVQWSTILGSIPPKAHMRRYKPNHSSVHQVDGAKTFVKAMWKLAVECEGIIKGIAPNIWERQMDIMKEVPDEWKFGNLFTSSISNYNISAPFHVDTGNLHGCVNVIVTKRLNAKGGSLHLPDYDLTIEQADGSLLVYPAWRNMHGVTPIIPTHEGGYRNSLIFYPLASFTYENLKKMN